MRCAFSCCRDRFEKWSGFEALCDLLSLIEEFLYLQVGGIGLSQCLRQAPLCLGLEVWGIGPGINGVSPKVRAVLSHGTREIGVGTGVQPLTIEDREDILLES